MVLLHELSVQLLEYKPGTLRIRIRVTVIIWIQNTHRSLEVGTWFFSMNSAYSF
jgi:hypothetical protein